MVGRQMAVLRKKWTCPSRKLESIDYIGKSPSLVQHQVAPGKASGDPSLLVISDIARWEGSIHDEGIRPIYHLFRIFCGSLPDILTNGDCGS